MEGEPICSGLTSVRSGAKIPSNCHAGVKVKSPVPYSVPYSPTPYRTPYQIDLTGTVLHAVQYVTVRQYRPSYCSILVRAVLALDTGKLETYRTRCGRPIRIVSRTVLTHTYITVWCGITGRNMVRRGISTGRTSAKYQENCSCTVLHTGLSHPYRTDSTTVRNGTAVPPVRLPTFISGLQSGLSDRNANCPGPKIMRRTSSVHPSQPS